MQVSPPSFRAYHDERMCAEVSTPCTCPCTALLHCSLAQPPCTARERRGERVHVQVSGADVGALRSMVQSQQEHYNVVYHVEGAWGDLPYQVLQRGQRHQQRLDELNAEAKQKFFNLVLAYGISHVLHCFPMMISCDIPLCS